MEKDKIINTKGKVDLLDPYQNYHFQDQNSPISETNLLKEQKIIEDKIHSLGRNNPVLIIILVIVLMFMIGFGISVFNGWIKFF